MQDYFITGGTVLTMNPAFPKAEAVFVRGNKITSVGTDAEVRNAADKDTKVYSLKGRTLIPGFNDCHMHVFNLGQQELMADLTHLSKSEIIQKLKEHESTLKPGEPLMGINWDYPYCPDPHKSDLDTDFPDRPVMLMQFSGHGGWANSAALSFFNMKKGMKDWKLGGPDRDPRGELTGILREPGSNPKFMIYWGKQILKRKAIRKALPIALSQLSSHGITSVQDNTWFGTILSELKALHKKGEQTVRISCWSLGTIPPIDFWFSHRRFNKDWYKLGPRKFFIDGSFSAKTAWLSEPYSDTPDIHPDGKKSKEIAGWLKKATRQKRQIACHAIGDGATKAYCDAAERLSSKPRHEKAASQLRHRIEHGQLIDPIDIDRIARFGMVVSAQPHAAADPEKDERLVGPDRARRAYPYRNLLDAGVSLAFGSDHPGEYTFNPLFGIHLAVNREGGQAITPQEAISCYTAGSARAEFEEHRKGQIAIGFLADMVILSEDPTTIDLKTIKDIRVDATIVDGKIVYERPGGEISG
jgi:predicted amidohydrolase YtcJ